MALKTLNKIILVITAIHSTKLQAQQVIVNVQRINDLTQEITCTFNLAQKDFVYKDFITFSIAHPQIKLSVWKANSSPTSYYDPLFKNTKQIFKKNFTISITVTANDYHDNPTYLYFSYYQRSEKKIKQLRIALNFTAPEQMIENNPSMQTHADMQQSQKVIKKRYIDHIDSYTHEIIAFLSGTQSINIMIIILLLLLCIIPPYFFTKKLHFSIQITELIAITTATSCCIAIGCIIYYARLWCPAYLITPITKAYVLSIGIFYIKKSTKLQWSYLRTLCNLIGMSLISTTVLLLFKTIQILSAVF